MTDWRKVKVRRRAVQAVETSIMAVVLVGGFFAFLYFVGVILRTFGVA